jgi:hypothetical protein
VFSFFGGYNLERKGEQKRSIGYTLEKWNKEPTQIKITYQELPYNEYGIKGLKFA